MLISVLGAGSVIEHGGSDLISSADASESLARSTNGGECNGDEREWEHISDAIRLAYICPIV